MPPVRFSRRASRDLVRLHEFLEAPSPEAAQRAVDAILQGLMRLEQFPALGRPVLNVSSEFREWIVEFGSGAYIVRYRVTQSEVVIVAVRHGREAGCL